jgi:hypothetical protein
MDIVGIRASVRHAAKQGREHPMAKCLFICPLFKFALVTRELSKAYSRKLSHRKHSSRIQATALEVNVRR